MQLDIVEVESSTQTSSPLKRLHREVSDPAFVHGSGFNLLATPNEDQWDQVQCLRIFGTRPKCAPRLNRPASVRTRETFRQWGFAHDQFDSNSGHEGTEENYPDCCDSLAALEGLE